MIKKLFLFPIVAGALIIIFAIFTIPNLISSDETDLKLTGTPADNFSEDQRSKFCGTGNATSTDYVTEYKIPTDCTLPQAITTDDFGNIWFVESNTGSVVKFDPNLKKFTEYKNRLWPKGGHSMMWGIDYSSDGTIWFTDEKHNSVWKFIILLKKYEQQSFSIDENAFPQKLKVHDSKLIINEFKGNRIVFIDFKEFEFKNPSLPILTDADKEAQSEFLKPEDVILSYHLQSIKPNAVTADFTIQGDNLWYTSWVLNGDGILAKINQTEFNLAIQNQIGNAPLETITLPRDLNTPNGITVDNSGNVWLADSSSSLFFKYDPIGANFTKYMTTNPQKSTYGNFTGEIKSPVSRPYWIDTDSSGKLIFNEQGSNRIGVFDPISELLVEYSIPSKNPYWEDCGDDQNCGLAQIFDFVIKGDQIWFTEWAENNLGVVDTTIPLPFELHLEENKISLHPGESYDFDFIIDSNSEDIFPASLVLSDSSDFLDVNTNNTSLEISISDLQSITVTLHADQKLPVGEYKVLLGAQTPQISISKFVTVIVDSPTIIP